MSDIPAPRRAATFVSLAKARAASADLSSREIVDHGRPGPARPAPPATACWVVGIMEVALAFARDTGTPS